MAVKTKGKVKSNLIQSTSHPHNKELVVLWISLVAIVLLVLLFPFIKDAAVGKAIASYENYPGFYWETAPEEVIGDYQDCNENQVLSWIDNGEGGLSKIAAGACCQNKNSCAIFMPNSEDLGCYSSNSIVNSYPTSLLCLSNTNSVVFGSPELDIKAGDSITDLMWLQCSSGNKFDNTLTVDNKFLCQANQWSACTETKLSSDQKFYCDSLNWEKCTSENAGLISEDGSYYCDGNKWSKEFSLSPNNLFEISFSAGSANVTSPIKINGYNYYFCDLATKNLADYATICRNSGNNVVVLKSLDLISSTNDAIFTAEGLLFLYEGGEDNLPKKVTVHTVVPLAAPKSMSILKVALNLLNGQRLALELGGQYYLLSHAGEDTFSGVDLVITHLPTQQEFLPQKISGDTFSFNLLAGKTLTILIEPLSFVISPFAPTEAPTSFTIPYNLDDNYQVDFSKNNPVNLVDLNSKIEVCLTDNSADPQSLLVCKDGQQGITLQKDVLTEWAIGSTEVALLYQVVNGSKQGYIFKKVDLSGVEQNLDYTSFINNMAAGRRAAFNFNGGLYLLKHPQSQFISLPSMNAVSYLELGSSSKNASGSEKKVNFMIPEGRITLERDYGTPPPPFRISALTKQQIVDTALDLERELFTSMSSQVPVKVTSPDNWGIISKSSNDIVQDKDIFQLSTGKADNLKLDLFYQTPMEAGKTLFYYSSASQEGTEFVKVASIYRLYNLMDGDSQDDNHIFDNLFLEKFTSGNELALKFNNTYFLLGYAGATSGQSSFFTLNDLSLHSLEGVNYPSTVDITEQTVKFTVPGGEIEIVKDAPNNKLLFSVQTEGQLLEQFSAEDYLQIINSGNSVKINNDVFSICDTSFTASKVEQAAVCKNGALVKVNGGPLMIGEVYPSIASGFLLVYAGVVNGEKQIKVYEIDFIGFDSTKYDWTTLTERLTEGKSKAYWWAGSYFELGAADPQKFSTYYFKSIPNGDIYPLQKVEMDQNLLESGFLVNVTLMVKAYQTLDQELEADFNLIALPHELLAVSGVNLTGDSSQYWFYPSVGEDLFNIQIKRAGASFTVSIYDAQDFQLQYQQANLPVGSKNEVLLANGEVVLVEILDTKTVRIRS
ncbi:MAG TPA: hypothetical protein VJC39_03475 [Candidatus Nanoarchaeia archaeon]|nr:hypothetical protein [Candidatus Nanoarchaeia archaeon]